jgi:thioredoxin reductase
VPRLPACEGADTLLIERSGLGGQAGITVGLDNFPGFPEGISGQESSDRVAQQARRFGVEVLQAQEVEKLGMEEGYHEVYTSDGKHYHSRAVLAATGASYRQLDVPGEDDFIGAGIHFCATCDGPFYKGSKEIVVVGGGNSAVEEGIVFIFIGQMPNTAFLKDYVEMDKYGFIISGHDLLHEEEMHDHRPLPFESSVPGIFVAGDTHYGSVKQVASAVGEGAAASISVREFLRKMG